MHPEKDEVATPLRVIGPATQPLAWGRCLVLLLLHVLLGCRLLFSNFATESDFAGSPDDQGKTTYIRSCVRERSEQPDILG